MTEAVSGHPLAESHSGARPSTEEAALLRHLGAGPETCSDLEDHVLSSPVGARAGRVIRAERSGADIATVAGTVRATWDQPVCTGDWVVVTTPALDHVEDPGHDPDGASTGSARVLYLQPRRTAIIRRAADADRPQVLAANIDEIWIVIAGDGPVSASRLERTLVLAWESGADPVVVLTKADIADPIAVAAATEVTAAVGPDVPVMVVSSVAGTGLAELTARVGPGRTAGLLGASGAGKSSLVNALVGTEVAAVGAVRRSDNRGRHTTNWRELAVLPGGGALIDTPGLRSIGLWVDDGGVDAAFADIVELARSCRFSDCAHHREPGCAVQAAIAAGTLPRRRLDSYDKLRQEADEAERRRLARAKDREERAGAARTRRIRRRDRSR
jgi:ribosome biogenesis GTPase